MQIGDVLCRDSIEGIDVEVLVASRFKDDPVAPLDAMKMETMIRANGLLIGIAAVASEARSNGGGMQ